METKEESIPILSLSPCPLSSAEGCPLVPLSSYASPLIRHLSQFNHAPFKILNQKVQRLLAENLTLQAT